MISSALVFNEVHSIQTTPLLLQRAACVLSTSTAVSNTPDRTLASIIINILTSSQRQCTNDLNGASTYSLAISSHDRPTHLSAIVPLMFVTSSYTTSPAAAHCIAKIGHRSCSGFPSHLPKHTSPYKMFRGPFTRHVAVAIQDVSLLPAKRSSCSSCIGHIGVWPSARALDQVSEISSAMIKGTGR